MVTCMGHRAKMEDTPCMLLACFVHAKGVHGACIGHAKQLALGVDGQCTLLRFTKRRKYMVYEFENSADILNTWSVHGRAWACTRSIQSLHNTYKGHAKNVVGLCTLPRLLKGSIHII